MVDVSNIFYPTLTLPDALGRELDFYFIVSSLYKAIMYKQVKLPPLINPPDVFGGNRKI
jgi:hypothetical protein